MPDLLITTTAAHAAQSTATDRFLPTLIGVVVGAAATGGIQIWITIRNQRAQRAERLREARQIAYADRIRWEHEYASTLLSLQAGQDSYADIRTRPDYAINKQLQQDLEDLAPTLRRLDDRIDELDHEGIALAASVALLASKNADHFAHLSRRALQEWAEAIREGGSAQNTAVEAGRFSTTSNAFLDAAQSDLGVTRLPNPPWFVRASDWWSYGRRRAWDFYTDAWRQMRRDQKSMREARRRLRRTESDDQP